MNTQLERPVVFTCGRWPLLGVLHPALGGQARHGVLIIVGGPQYRVGSHRQFVHLARALAAANVPVLRFDCRGMGDSAGQFTTFEHIGADVRAAIDAFLREIPQLEQIVLFGLCDAASAALMYCCSDTRVGALALANPWVRTASGEAASYVRHYYGHRVLQMGFWRKLLSGRLNALAAFADLVRSLARMRSSGGQWDRSKSFIDEMVLGLEGFAGPVLLLLSDRDLTAKEFQELSRTSPKWTSLLGRSSVDTRTCARADHTFSSVEARERMTSMMIDWLQGRRQQPAPGDAARTAPRHRYFEGERLS